MVYFCNGYKFYFDKKKMEKWKNKLYCQLKKGFIYCMIDEFKFLFFFYS